MKTRIAILSVICCAAFTSCQAGEPKSSGNEPAAAEAGSKVRFKTSEGVIVVALDAEKAPITVENFLKYVNKGHYAGTVFHRVIEGFMIQGGGFKLEGEKLVEKASGEGIKNESQNGLKNLEGTVAMARTNDPDSATAQFFINVKDNGMLDYPNNNGYAVFGKVVEGMEVVNKIKKVATGNGQIVMLHPVTGEKLPSGADDVPKTPVVIESVSVE